MKEDLTKLVHEENKLSYDGVKENINNDQNQISDCMIKV